MAGGDGLVAWGLAVDLGTSYTSACRFDERGTTAVEVDGRRRVPSAVLLGEDGRLVAGTIAERGGATAPDRLERTPKRAVGRPFVILGGQRIAVADALGALLRLVADEAVRQVGGRSPSELVLTHPARWGAERRSALAAAARQAQLPSPTLVPEPVAAAARYLRERPLRTTVAVYDLGGGTFDTAVVQATSDGPLVLGDPGGDEDLGGETFDHALFRLVLAHLEEREPGVTEPLLDSPERRWQRAALDLLDEVRRAKEALSTQLQTSVYFPLLDAEVVLTRGELDDLIRADVTGTVEELVRTLAVAGRGPEEIDAVHLVGGSSRIPLVSRLLREAFGDVLQTYDDPKYVVVDGAAELASSRAPDVAAPPLSPPPPLVPPLVPPEPVESDPVEADSTPTEPLLDEPIRDDAPLWGDASGSPGSRRPALAVAAAAAVALAVVAFAGVAWSTDVFGGDDPSSTPSASTSAPPTQSPTSPASSSPPTTPVEEPSFSGVVAESDLSSVRELFSFLRDHDEEVVVLDVELDLESGAITSSSDPDDPPVEIVFDAGCTDDEVVVCPYTMFLDVGEDDFVPAGDLYRLSGEFTVERGGLVDILEPKITLTEYTP